MRITHLNLNTEDSINKVLSKIDKNVDGVKELGQDAVGIVGDENNFKNMIKKSEFHIPKHDAPDGMRNEDYLRKLVNEGLENKYKMIKNINSNIIKKRSKHELDVIINNNFTDYILFVYDIVHFAKTNNIPVGPGSGSAASSMVLYALDITDIEPIKYGLIFERFINEEKIVMPDIEIRVSLGGVDKIKNYISDDLGYLKQNILVLKILDEIKYCIEKIRKEKGINLDLNRIPYDDENVYKMISSGDTKGVLNFELDGYIELAKKLKPSTFEDLIAIYSMNRPLPIDYFDEFCERKYNQNKIIYDHPKLKPILEMTYGFIIYQEQITQILHDAAGYSFGKAEIVRRAMAKRQYDKIELERNNFIYGNDELQIKGCCSNGLDKETANIIFDKITKFSGYAFLKTHAAASVKLSYQSAYLKYYYNDQLAKSSIGIKKIV